MKQTTFGVDQQGEPRGVSASWRTATLALRECGAINAGGRSHGTTAFISAKKRSRRVVRPLLVHASKANVVCFIVRSPCNPPT